MAPGAEVHTILYWSVLWDVCSWFYPELRRAYHCCLPPVVAFRPHCSHKQGTTLQVHDSVVSPTDLLTNGLLSRCWEYCGWSRKRGSGPWGSHHVPLGNWLGIGWGSGRAPRTDQIPAKLGNDRANHRTASTRRKGSLRQGLCAWLFTDLCAGWSVGEQGALCSRTPRRATLAVTSSGKYAGIVVLSTYTTIGFRYECPVRSRYDWAGVDYESRHHGA